MPEIKRDLTDPTRCVSVHWTLPAQCVLPNGHRENWHETWHPQTRTRVRYRRSMGVYATEEARDGGWRDLEIPPPGGRSGDQYRSGLDPDLTGVSCTEPYGHGWHHHAVVNGCRYSWNTPVPPALTRDQLDHDVRHLRAAIVQLAAERDAVYAERAHLLAWLATLHPAVITEAPDVDEPGWLLLYITAAGRQLAWHIAPRDADLFARIERVEVGSPRARYDGHTTPEKYAWIRQIAASSRTAGTTR